MNDPRKKEAQRDSAPKLSPKLRAALEYLGDRLTTHPASRFKPATLSLLDEWRLARRATLECVPVRVDGGYCSWMTTAEFRRLSSLHD